MAVVVLGVGGSDGTNVAIGSPSNFTLVNTAGGTIKYDVDRSVVVSGGGTVLGWETVSAAGANCIARYQAASTSADRSDRGWIWGPGTTPSETITVVTQRTFDGTTARAAIGHLLWTTANALTFTGKSGAALTLATGLDPAQVYEVSTILHIATATTGTLTAKVWDSSGTQVGSTVTSSTLDLGASPALWEGIDLGVPASLVSPHVVGHAAWQTNIGGTTEISRYTAGAAPASTVRPVSTFDNSGGYTPSGGPTDIAVACGDNNATTKVIGPTAAGTGLDMTVTLADAVVMSTGGTFTIRQLKLTGSGGTYTVSLMKGATVIKTWTLTPTTTATDYPFTFSGAEASTIGATLTDWAGLRLRVRSAA
jgi:hypothetical protein